MPSDIVGCPLCGAWTKYHLLIPIKDAVLLPDAIPKNTLKRFIRFLKENHSPSVPVKHLDNDLETNVCLVCINLLGSCMEFFDRKVLNTPLSALAITRETDLNLENAVCPADDSQVPSSSNSVDETQQQPDSSSTFDCAQSSVSPNASPPQSPSQEKYEYRDIARFPKSSQEVSELSTAAPTSLLIKPPHQHKVTLIKNQVSLRGDKNVFSMCDVASSSFTRAASPKLQLPTNSVNKTKPTLNSSCDISTVETQKQKDFLSLFNLKKTSPIAPIRALQQSPRLSPRLAARAGKSPNSSPVSQYSANATTASDTRTFSGVSTRHSPYTGSSKSNSVSSPGKTADESKEYEALKPVDSPAMKRTRRCLNFETVQNSPPMIASDQMALSATPREKSASESVPTNIVSDLGSPSEHTIAVRTEAEVSTTTAQSSTMQLSCAALSQSECADASQEQSLNDSFKPLLDSQTCSQVNTENGKEDAVVCESREVGLTPTINNTSVTVEVVQLKSILKSTSSFKGGKKIKTNSKKVSFSAQKHTRLLFDLDTSTYAQEPENGQGCSDSQNITDKKPENTKSEENGLQISNEESCHKNFAMGPFIITASDGKGAESMNEGVNKSSYVVKNSGDLDPGMQKMLKNMFSVVVNMSSKCDATGSPAMLNSSNVKAATPLEPRTISTRQFKPEVYKSAKKTTHNSNRKDAVQAKKAKLDSSLI